MQSTLTEPLSRSRILVVEDEAIIAEEIHHRLTELDFDVVGIKDSGQEALEAVSATNPDLVLMDIRLKGELDGIEVARIIRENADVPIVYLTAHSDPLTLQRARETAPLGYILKPIHERELEVTIGIAIQRSSLERRLRESELRYAATLRSIGDAVVTTDREGRINFMNAVAESLTGWPGKEAMDRRSDQVLVFINETTSRRIEDPIARALRECAPVRLDHPTLLMARDGTPIPIDDTAAPIIDRNGRVLGVVLAFNDIRDRRRTEAALRKAEEGLRQAQKMESIGQLAGGVAHDFNNFLTAINGYCDMLAQDDCLSPEGAELLDHMHKASERCAKLTTQLLAFSRQQVLAPEVLDLNTLVNRCESLLSRVIGEHIHLHVDLASDLNTVRADPTQIEQIILNLAVNARDAMPNGGRLDIDTANCAVTQPMTETKPHMSPGRYARLTISDTGAGMDQETQDRIFEPFFTTKDFGVGTGMGLATVYGIVKQSGGHIYVYSELGQGTVFKIYFPVVDEAPTIHPPAKVETTPTGTETVMIVEDDDAVRHVTTQALLRFGYSVVSARDGKEAIELYQRQPDAIEALVTDTVLPGLSGPQVAEQLLKLNPDLPVLFLSGYIDRSIDAALTGFPDAPFLQKPFSAAVLAGKVRQVIDRRSAKS